MTRLRQACTAAVAALAIAGGAARAGAQDRLVIPVAQPGTVLQGFSVVLLIGETEGGQSSDDIPAAARRALADMKDFLPFKAYRVLDTGWMMGSLPVRSGTMRVRGPESRDLDVMLIANSAIAGMNVKFSLVEKVGAIASPIIDTTFNMSVGETVVVGTSRTQGNTALIALLTAVPRDGK